MILLTCVLVLAHSMTADTVRDRLITQEKASWDLAIKHDTAAYKALHAPEFFEVGGKGVTDRAQSEASALDPNVSFDQLQFSDFRVDFVGKTTAFVTYRVKVAGVDHGKKFDSDSYVGSVWQERGGKWLNVYYQSTPATM
jgi:hypothetical protein